MIKTKLRNTVRKMRFKPTHVHYTILSIISCLGPKGKKNGKYFTLPIIKPPNN